MKTCSKCNQSKPIQEFKRDKRRLNGTAGICKPCSKLSCFEWRKENIEHCHLYDAARTAKGTGKKKSVDPEKHRLRNKLWEKANPDKVRANWRNKRARRQSAEGKHSSQDIDRLVIIQKNKCAYCKKSLLKVKRHVDHIVPIALGGTNWPHNLQLLCPLCNMKKNAKDPIDFAQQIGLLI